MSSVRVRRAAALGLVLALALSGVAAADTIVADGDSVAADSQMAVDLGDVAPGATVPVDVAFHLTCKNSSHATGGSAITVAVFDQTWPADGSATVTDGRIEVPADWPAPGASCPDTGLPTTVGATPAHLELTAPTALGTGYEFLFLFAPDPATGISGSIAFSATMNVVEQAPPDPTPPDTTPPVLAGMPADVTVFTSGTSAVVSYTPPTATDDADPNPVVACDPASGAEFGLGTTTVTCTATDAAGNTAAATFDVSVRQLTAMWGQPLDSGAVPALTGQLGRTVPLKLSVAGLGPGDAAPLLRLDQLGTCAVAGVALSSRAGGTFRWDSGTWRLNLDTTGLGAGCWRLVATSGAGELATAVVRLVPDTAGKTSAARSMHRHRARHR